MDGIRCNGSCKFSSSRVIDVVVVVVVVESMGVLVNDNDGDGAGGEVKSRFSMCGRDNVERDDGDLC